MCGRVGGATCSARSCSSERGREMGYTQRIEERKVRAGVSKRVAKCNLKKERTSSPTTTLSSPLTTARPLAAPSHPRATTRKKKAKSSVWFTIQPAYSQPTLPSFPPFAASSSSSLALSRPRSFLTSRHRSCLISTELQVHFEFARRESLCNGAIDL